MESPKSEEKLEKLLKKLENLDIRAWTYMPDRSLTTEICGLKFEVENGYLEIKDIRGGPYSVFYHACDIKNKPLRERLKWFYQTIGNKLEEHQKKEIEEKLESFLLE